MTHLKSFPSRLFEAQISALRAASEKHGVSTQDLLRLALDRGLPILEAQIEAEVKVAPVPLPPRVIEEARVRKMRARSIKGVSS